MIGIGNPLCGDDFAGRAIARRIKELRIRSLRVLEHDGEGTSLMELWKECRTVIVVDAVSSGSPPGTIHRFDAARRPLPGKIGRGSTHPFGLNEAVELSRALGQLPTQLVVYGIEGRSFTCGEELSPEVQRALPQLIDRVLQEIGMQGRSKDA